MDIVFKVEIFVCKSPCTIDSGATSAITIEEISALNHEVFDLRRQPSEKEFCLALHVGETWY